MSNHLSMFSPHIFTHRLRSSTLAATLLLTAVSVQPSTTFALGTVTHPQPQDLIGISLLPTVSTPPLVSAQVGQAVSLQIGATGSPTSYGATGLPAGLSINPTTGLISGTPTQAGLCTGTVSASNLLGTGTASLTINVLPANPVPPVVTAPVITSPTVATGQVGQALSFQIGGTNNPTSYGATNLPAGLSINASSGLISGTPTQSGVFLANVTASNLVGSGSAPLTLTILPGGVAVPSLPTITSPSATSGQVGQLLTYQIGATGSPTSFAASGLPAGLMLDTTSGLISGTPTQSGVFTASLTATNAQGSTSTPLTLTILPNGTGSPIQVVPTITSPVAASGQVGQLLTYQIGATGSPTSFAATGLPAGLSVSASTGLISGAPTQSGVFMASVTASNALGTGSTTLTLTVLPADTGAPVASVPTIISPATSSGQVGQLFTYQIGATGNPTTYAAVNLPAGLSVDASTGLISGTPTQAGTTTASVSARNAAGTGTASLTLTIAPDSTGTSTTAPVVTSTTPPPVGQTGVAYSYQITASGNPTSYGATGLPPGLSIDTSSGLVAGTPTRAGTYTAVLTASNAAGMGATTATFTINPTAPMITSPAEVDVVLGVSFTFQLEATGNPTSYAAGGLPTGLSVNTTTGVISGTATQTGVFPVTVGATNGGGTTTGTLTFNVQQGESTKPTISSPATTVAQMGQPFSYQITASNNPTSFGAMGLPTGLSVNSSTGLISGIPMQSGVFNVVLTATGPTGTGTGIMRLAIAGSAPASAPVITSATSDTARVGDAYSYQITATNSPTNYGATGLPAGLTLDTGTGLISGAPTKAGNFSFVISAANASGSGETTVSLVIAPVLPVVTLSASVPSFTMDSGEMGQFELTRTGSTAQILVVTYTIHGTAANGTDIEKLKGVKKFKVGRSVVHINVVPLVRDLGGADKKTVKIILDARPTYQLSGSPQAKVKMFAR